VYSDFGKLDFVRALDGRIGTINAMAVRPKYRWGSCTIRRGVAGANPIGLSDVLMTNMIAELGRMGTEVILLSAVYKPAYSLMRRIGFKMINPPSVQLPQDYSFHADVRSLTLCDMAIITRDVLETPVSGQGAGEPKELSELRIYLHQADENFRIEELSDE